MWDPVVTAPGSVWLSDALRGALHNHHHTFSLYPACYLSYNEYQPTQTEMELSARRFPT